MRVSNPFTESESLITGRSASSSRLLVPHSIRLDAPWRAAPISAGSPRSRRTSAWSDGRRVLPGDAAHLSSPLGGEGLNAAPDGHHEPDHLVAIAVAMQIRLRWPNVPRIR